MRKTTGWLLIVFGALWGAIVVIQGFTGGPDGLEISRFIGAMMLPSLIGIMGLYFAVIAKSAGKSKSVHAAQLEAAIVSPTFSADSGGRADAATGLSQASSETEGGLMESVPHSGLGIASFIIAMIVGLAFIALFVVAGVLASRSAGSEYPGQAVVGTGALILLAFDVVAAGLGIAGICQAGRRRVFAILGLTFSALTLIGGVALIAIGIMLASSMNA